mmetsp:Transcript_49/g.97  ORF Transcript_49/g.97 Transcript_49/m.97 type:complete len:341 (+) Transcript_49:184-1206(+)
MQFPTKTLRCFTGRPAINTSSPGPGTFVNTRECLSSTSRPTTAQWACGRAACEMAIRAIWKIGSGEVFSSWHSSITRWRRFFMSASPVGRGREMKHQRFSKQSGSCASLVRGMLKGRRARCCMAAVRLGSLVCSRYLRREPQTQADMTSFTVQLKCARSGLMLSRETLGAHTTARLPLYLYVCGLCTLVAVSAGDIGRRKHLRKVFAVTKAAHKIFPMITPTESAFSCWLAGRVNTPIFNGLPSASETTFSSVCARETPSPTAWSNRKNTDDSPFKFLTMWQSQSGLSFSRGVVTSSLVYFSISSAPFTSTFFKWSGTFTFTAFQFVFPFSTTHKQLKRL